MKLTLMATTKRINSFTRPDEDETRETFTVLSPVYFKDDNISMSNPKIFIAAANYPEVNYCVLEDFDSTIGGGHVYRPSKIYYWITDIVHDHENRWWIECQIDLLATWKNKILSQTAFIERSASKFNPMVIDNEIPLSNNLVYQKASGTNDNVIDAEGGCWLLLYRGNNAAVSSAGGVSAVLMTSSQQRTLAFEMNAPNTIQSIRNIFGDVNEGLVKLKFLPFPISQFSVHQDPVPIIIGNTSTGVQLGAATGYSLQAGVSFKQTYILGFGSKKHDFRDTSYATRYKLFLPGVGLIDITGEDVIASSDSICTVYCYMDALSGTIVYSVKITADSSLETSPIYRIGDYYAEVGLDIPLSTFMAGNPVKAIGSVIAMAGLAIGGASVPLSKTGHLSAQALGMFYGAATAGGSALYNTFQGSGSMVGGFSGANTYALGRKIELYKLMNNTTIDPSLIASTLGRPCYEVHQLSALSGYTKTRNFRLQNTGYMTVLEQSKVEDMFNNEGVFI